MQGRATLLGGPESFTGLLTDTASGKTYALPGVTVCLITDEMVDKIANAVVGKIALAMEQRRAEQGNS